MQTLKIFILSVVLSSQVHARVTSHAAPETTPSAVPTYSEMKEAWTKGRTPSEKELEGKWMLVARTWSAAECGDKDIAVYSPDGLLAPDNGKKRFLKFSYALVPGNEFTGQPDVRVFNVQPSSYLPDKLEQKPYLVHAKEPQFSHWLLDFEGAIINDLYVEVTCRLVGKSGDKLVCALKAKVTNLHKYLDGQYCNGRTFGVDGFKRVKN